MNPWIPIDLRVATQETRYYLLGSKLGQFVTRTVVAYCNIYIYIYREREREEKRKQERINDRNVSFVLRVK